MPSRLTSKLGARLSFKRSNCTSSSSSEFPARSTVGRPSAVTGCSVYAAFISVSTRRSVLLSRVRMKGELASSPNRIKANPASSATMPALALIGRDRPDGAAIEFEPSELEVDERICLICPQERYDQRAGQSKSDSPLYRCRCHKILIARFLQCEVEQEERNRKDCQKQECRGELGPPSPVCQAAQHFPGRSQRLRAKENPCQAHKMENENSFHPHRNFPRFGAARQLSFHRQTSAMQSAPHDEGPVCAVPESSQQHGQHQVAIRLALAVAISAQRNI